MNSELPDSLPNPLNPPVKEVGEQKKEVRLIEKLLEINLGLTIVLGGVVVFLVILVASWRFNLAGYFNKGLKNEQAVLDQSQMVVSPAKLAAEKPTPPIFINTQVVDIQKAFKADPNRIRLTISGRLKKEVLGFLPYWAVEKANEINTKLLTSVSYFGLEVDGGGNIIKDDGNGKPVEAWARWENDPRLSLFIKNAKKNRLKVYVTLKAFNNTNIERLVRSKEASTNFITNALYLVNSKALDGVNIDFEYVGTPDQSVIDGFSILIADLNRELKRQFPKAVLTVDTYISAASSTQLYDVEMISRNSDALVIMGYDFHTPNSSQAGPVAPMEGYGTSVTGFMSGYLEKVPPEKLILAVGYYGYDWPVSSGGMNGEVTGNRGEVRVYPYAEIMEATRKVEISWDESAKTPWYSYRDPATGGMRVVHFENTRSLGIKYDFVNQKNLQGVGIWALGYEGRNTDLLQLLADKFAN